MADMLKVISAVETGSNANEVRSQYQFIRTTWEKHSIMPWAYVLAHPTWKDVQDEATRAAFKEARWICQQLETNGRFVNPYNIAMCWRGGVEGFLRGDPPDSYVDYAQRAENLFFVKHEPVTNSDGYAFAWRDNAETGS